LSLTGVVAPYDNQQMDDSTYFSRDFSSGFELDFALRGAEVAAAANELGDWLQAYLSAEAPWANPGLAQGLLLRPRAYSLFEIEVDRLVRKCGPEPEMEYWQDPESFQTCVTAIARSLDSIENLPPLVVEEVEGRYIVCDGTHRLEAIRAKGWPTCWVILFEDV
jgi:hypothetical protein